MLSKSDHSHSLMQQVHIILCTVSKNHHVVQIDMHDSGLLILKLFTETIVLQGHCNFLDRVLDIHLQFQSCAPSHNNWSEVSGKMTCMLLDECESAVTKLGKISF